MLGQVLLALRLVQFTGPDNQLILLNPEQIIGLKEPRGQPGAHFHASVKCLVFTSDSKYTPVIETCSEVRRKLESFEEEDKDKL
jgi:hypothetical protein